VVAAGGVAIDDTSTIELLEALASSDPGRALTAVAEATRLGRDPRVVGEALLEALRGVFLVAMGAAAHHLTDAERTQAEAFAARLSPPAITRALELVGTALVDMRQAPDPRVDLEVALVRLTRASTDLSLEALADRLARLERALAEGSVPPAPVAAAPGASAAPSPPAPSTPPAPAPPSRPRRGGPADEARGLLGRSGRGAERPASPSRPARAASQTRPSEPTPAERGAPPPTAAAPASDNPTSSGALPNIDELRNAWESVVQSLPNKAKARYGIGRFVEVTDSHAVLAFPNEPHRKRCDELRTDVEHALAARFGRPVPLRLIVDGAAAAPEGATASRGGGGPSPANVVDLPPDEPIDLDELTDAPAGGGILERLTSAFPGAELLDDS
jgi:DNA polymerase-3 subunit gamma/tau